MDMLTAIQNWYASNCNGDWEQSYGVRITTLDNPGWAVDIDLRGTPLEAIIFEPIELDRGEDDWIRCKIQDSVFYGRCGPNNLTKLLEAFCKLCS